MMSNRAAYVDEINHLAQIKEYRAGSLIHLSYITAGPGYHLITSQISQLFNLTSISAVRAVSLFYGLLLLFFSSLCLKEIFQTISKYRIIQIMFLPILFPYFFLIYTDVFSASLCVAAFYFLLKCRHHTAGLLSLLSIMVRQTNIVWVVSSVVYVVVRKFDLGDPLKSLKNISVSVIPQCIICGLFLVFIYLNEGIAMGDRGAHQSGIYFNNLFFFPLTLVVVLFPLQIANFNRIVSFTKKNWLTVLGVFVGAFVFYLFSFGDLHVYNLGMEFARNRLLVSMTENWLLKTILFLPMFYGIVSFVLTPLMDKSYYFIFFMTLAILLPSYLVEPRYYIIPIIFYQIVRVNYPPKVEMRLALYSVILSGWVVVSISNGSLYL